MPNWCTTSYVFRGNEKEIKDFYNKIKSFTSKERIPNDFGDFWLGNVVDGFGFNWKEIKCKGLIDYFPDSQEDTDSDRLELSTQTAWEPMTEMWNKIIEKYYPSISYVLIAEEPGCELYINTDITGEDFSERFSVDFKLPPKYDCLCENGFYADCEENVVEEFNSIFHRDTNLTNSAKRNSLKSSKRRNIVIKVISSKYTDTVKPSKEEMLLYERHCYCNIKFAEVKRLYKSK